MSWATQKRLVGSTFFAPSFHRYKRKRVTHLGYSSSSLGKGYSPRKGDKTMVLIDQFG